MGQLAFDLTPRAQACKAPVCERPCSRAVCPYELDTERSKFRSAHRKGRVIGPLPWAQGRWLETVEGCNPWGET
jgi:hypothetical protein